uniref:Secreted protein n=1 Tax=Panstrongylus lignarius TaxID=156445 RepID=A0A224Y4P1_9HEMI
MSSMMMLVRVCVSGASMVGFGCGGFAFHTGDDLVVVGWLLSVFGREGHDSGALSKEAVIVGGTCSGRSRLW